MPTRGEERRRILQRILAQNEKSDSPDTAQAVVQQWQTLADKFDPLLGPDGVRLIYVRSLELNKAHFPWLPAAFSSAPPFDNLRRCFEGRPASDITAVNAALLLTFSNLLTALIGERLTTQLLQAAFAAEDAKGTIAPAADLASAITPNTALDAAPQETQNDGQN